MVPISVSVPAKVATRTASTGAVQARSASLPSPSLGAVSTSWPSRSPNGTITALAPGSSRPTTYPPGSGWPPHVSSTRTSRPTGTPLVIRTRAATGAAPSTISRTEAAGSSASVSENSHRGIPTASPEKAARKLPNGSAIGFVPGAA